MQFQLQLLPVSAKIVIWDSNTHVEMRAITHTVSGQVGLEGLEEVYSCMVHEYELQLCVN